MGFGLRPGSGQRSRYSFLIIVPLFVLIINVIHADFIPLDKLLNEIDANLMWEPARKTGRIVRGDKWIVFKPGLSFILLGSRKKIATEEIVKQTSGNILFPLKTVKMISDYLTINSAATNIDINTNANTNTHRVAVILIDPGHGGKDPGAIGRHLLDGKTHVIKEKDVVLDVCRRFYRLLCNRYTAKKILLTRNSDTYLELEERTEIANSIPLQENEAIIFVSVHANAAFSKKANGFEVWYLPPEYKRELIDKKNKNDYNPEIIPILNRMLDVEYTTESVILAKEILESMEKEVGYVTENRGLKAENWFVVRKSKMPSVLIELGFVTNKDEAIRMEQDEYLQKLAMAIFNGVQKFINRFENTRGFTK